MVMRLSLFTMLYWCLVLLVQCGNALCDTTKTLESAPFSSTNLANNTSRKKQTTMTVLASSHSATEIDTVSNSTDPTYILSTTSNDVASYSDNSEADPPSVNISSTKPVAIGSTIANSMSDVNTISSDFDPASYNKTTTNVTFIVTTSTNFRSVFCPLIAAVSLFGVCGNSVSLFVWNAAPAFNPTLFYMKALAISDTTYNIVIVVRLYEKQMKYNYVFGQFIKSVYLLSIALSTNTTMLLVFTRWLAVYKPMSVTRLLTRCHVVTCYVLMLIVILLVVILDNFVKLSVLFHTAAYSVFILLPVAVVLCLNICLVRMVRTCGHSSQLGHQQQANARVTGGSSRFYRLLTAVVCLSVTTVLSSPALVTTDLIVFFDSDPFPLSGILYLTAQLMTAFNSSINVYYYLAFASQFRQLLRYRLSRCCPCRRNEPQPAPTRDISRISHDSSVNTSVL